MSETWQLLPREGKNSINMGVQRRPHCTPVERWLSKIIIDEDS